MVENELRQWFSTVIPSGNLSGSFAHLWLHQAACRGWDCVRPSLIGFLERAHRDARNFFNEDLCISLDSFGGAAPAVSYPGSLPSETLLSYFGEAFCGIISEAIQIVGQRTWTIPVFLFRMHNVAGEHIHRLIYGEPVPPKITGRTGSDFIALCLDDERNVVALLVGEAKCHVTFNVTLAHQALEDLGKQAATPVSLGQLKRVMGELPARDWRQTVRSIDQILLTRAAVDRTDLFVYLFENPAIKNYVSPRLPQSVAAKTHGIGRPLQIVEVCFPDLRDLVADVYPALYASEGVPSATN